MIYGKKNNADMKFQNHSSNVQISCCLQPRVLSTLIFHFALQIIYSHFFCLFLAAIVLLTNLEPNTTYELQVAAVNGKGQGEFSRTESFQTLPIRESPSL